MDVIRVRDGRPVDAVRTCSVERSPVAAPSGGKKNTIGKIIASTLDDITSDTVHGRPSPITLVAEGL